jgi:hypothetical protein
MRRQQQCPSAGPNSAPATVTDAEVPAVVVAADAGVTEPTTAHTTSDPTVNAKTRVAILRRCDIVPILSCGSVIFL